MKPLIVTIDPQLIKHILNSEEFLNKANVLYQSMDSALPNGLITSKFFKWKHNRKLMNPSFSPQNLQRFIPIFIRNTEKISQHFDALLDEKEHSIFGFLQKSVMDMALETIMGLELNSYPNLSKEMVTNMHELMDKICIDTAMSPMKLGFLVRNSSYYRILEYLQLFLKQYISDKSLNPAANAGDEFFLNRALKYQQQGLFHSEDTITETYTMISGSYETTSTTLYSLIVMLAMHPDVQEKLYQDVLKIITNNEQINNNHLDQLPYLNMIINETLRLVPPIPFIGRETLVNCKLTEEVTLPRDFEVLISLFHLHRCTAFWGPNADKFNPDNFLNEKIEKRHPYAYVPYSKGVRNCIDFKWKHNRKLMNPSFTAQIVQQFVPAFNECSKKLAHYFGSLDGRDHAIFAHLKQEILQMAVGTTMGTVLAEDEILNDNMATNFNKLLEKIVTGIILSFVKLSFLIRTPGYYKIISNLKSYLENLIKRKLELNSETEGVHFLDRAIKYQQQNIFEMDDTITETYTMIIGSFETVSTTLSSLITMLAMHQDVQQKLYQEIIQMIGCDETVEFKHLDKMPYLNMVIDETLRLMPPIPIVGRESLESCNLTNEIKLSRDFQILISIFHLHRRQDLWGTNAEQFDPDNFLPDNVETRHPYAYIPFSKGLRNCVGWRYALIALKVLAVNVVRDFQMFTEFPYSKLIFINQVSLRFLQEPKIRFVKRKASRK